MNLSKIIIATMLLALAFTPVRAQQKRDEDPALAVAYMAEYENICGKAPAKIKEKLRPFVSSADKDLVTSFRFFFNAYIIKMGCESVQAELFELTEKATR